MTECLRDIDLERDIKQVASKGDSHMVHTRWCHSMAGQEFARLYSWGNDPKRRVSDRNMNTGHGKRRAYGQKSTFPPKY